MRTFRILAVILAALALSAAAVRLTIGHAADRKWASARERIRQLGADHPVLVPPMPSTPASKELQIQFIAAIRTASRRSMRQPNVAELQDNMGTDSVLDILEDAKEFLVLLHQAGRNASASPKDFPPGWRSEWDGGTLRHMMECCVIRARQLRELNQPFEAAETLLDSLQLGRFWTISGWGDGRINSLQALAVPLEELHRLLAKEPLTREQLLRLDRELEPLDRALPSPVDALDPALARFGETLTGLVEKDLVQPPYRWRYFLPFSLMKVQAFEFAETAVLQLRAAAESSHLKLRRSMQQIDGECTVSRNPIIGDGFWFAQPFFWVAFQRMAEVRLLRTAVRYRATGEILRLNDPLGSDYRHARTPARMKFWSPGPDGVDDGGVPGKDLVLEVDHPGPE